jgi:hypothetical protein
MKKFIILILGVFMLKFTSAQTHVATWDPSDSSYTIRLDHDYYSDIEGSLISILDLHVESLVLDSIVIDDDDPSVIDSAAYLVFYVSTSEGGFAIGLYLSKRSNNGFTEFDLEPTETTAGKSWKCTHNKECNQCQPKRTWFLGPVTGCKCADCIYDTAGNGTTTETIIKIIGVAVQIAALFK